MIDYFNMFNTIPFGYDKLIKDAIQEEYVLRLRLLGQPVEYEFNIDIQKETGMVGFSYDGQNLKSLILYINTDYFLIEVKKSSYFQYQNIKVIGKGIKSLDSSDYFLMSDKYYFSFFNAINQYVDNIYEKRLVISHYLDTWDKSREIYISEEILKYNDVYIKYYYDAYENFPIGFDEKYNIKFQLLELDINSSYEEGIELILNNKLDIRSKKIILNYSTGNNDLLLHLCSYISKLNLPKNIYFKLYLWAINKGLCEEIVHNYNLQNNVILEFRED